MVETLHSEILPHREKVGGSREVTSLGMNSLISFGCCTVYLCCAREDDVSPSLLFIYSYPCMKARLGDSPLIVAVVYAHRERER